MLIEYAVFFGLIIVIALGLVLSKKKSNDVDFDESIFYDEDDLGGFDSLLTFIFKSC